ncbi:class I SAM-dependent methyltransferase [Catellatospora tritici]|uniref:class I SAM-dependent methyltransferase n=1 Tax=Catellatospora tritici TaxID=2851566 RepID=UPI001C2DE929|nr:class I SAM-dependent methyltransferase [Catellatospora tritici]MBV1856669.1 class I SAM-dependent methyltransferase [Catellatospora tritici]
MSDFEKLVAEGESVPVEGWDFTWFEGRATEERPPWGYLRLVSERMAGARAALDIQTGGGEVLAKIPTPPPILVATESWPPNLAIAGRNLRPLGGKVVLVDEDAPLPFDDASFDLVVSRHPTGTDWSEIARVLTPGGTYLSQQIGAGTNIELSRFFKGPREIPDRWRTDYRVALAKAAGLDIVDVREATLRVVFYDVAAVIVFLRKVIWTVDDFSVARYRDRLADMHTQIERDGSFVSHAQRFLIETRKP